MKMPQASFGGVQAADFSMISETAEYMLPPRNIRLMAPVDPAVNTWRRISSLKVTAPETSHMAAAE